MEIILIHVFNTMFTKKSKEFIPANLYLVDKFLVLCQVGDALRNFQTFLALDFAQLLQTLENRLKFHINIE